MSFLETIGRVLLALLEYGGLGAIAVLAILWAMRKDRETRKAQEEIRSAEKAHYKEMLKSQEQHMADMIEVNRETRDVIASMNGTLEQLLRQDP